MLLYDFLCLLYTRLSNTINLNIFVTQFLFNETKDCVTSKRSLEIRYLQAILDILFQAFNFRTLFTNFGQKCAVPSRFCRYTDINSFLYLPTQTRFPISTSFLTLVKRFAEYVPFISRTGEVLSRRSRIPRRSCL